MTLTKHWKAIRLHFNKSFRKNLHVAVASVGNDNMPTVTPIGSMFLNGNQTGFYFEKYASRLPAHAKTNKNVCVLAVNSNKWFWLKALFKGVFKAPPAIKLYGELGETRKASEVELSRLKRRMKSSKGMKGHEYLWGDMAIVRDITFTKAEVSNLGNMTKGIFGS